jgi:filamentous hemagglutinin family protein
MAAVLHPTVIAAQGTTAVTSSGLNTTVTVNGNVRDVTGGTRSGANLFHSFGLFSIAGTDTARFLNTTPGLATSNIIGRVTEGQSVIHGTIDSLSYPGANLFLINPAGWVFGPTATLNVGGSFHVSSADNVRFPDVGGQPARFHADPARPSVLSSAPPVAFGFLGPTVAPITIQGSLLRVPDGATLSVVGGDVAIGLPATLMAPGGRIQIASVASAGEAGFDPAGNLDVASVPLLGRIDILGSAIDASDFSGAPAGAVSIVGGQLVIDGSSIRVDTTGAVEGLQPAIRVQAASDLVIANASVIGVTTSGDGPVGDIDVSGRNVSLSDGSVISSQTFGAGRGGDIRVTATETLSVSGRDAFGNPSDISSFTSFTGQGGRITVSAPTVSLDGGGRIRTLTFGEGAGGDVLVNATRFGLADSAQIVSGAAFTGVGGDITVTADAITLLGGPGTRIASSAAAEVGADLEISRVGDIVLSGRTIDISGGAQVQSGNLLQDAGNVTLQATESIRVASGSRISSQAFESKGGVIRIATPALSIDDAIIDTGTLGIGDAGDVFVDAARLSLVNGGKIVSSAQMFSGGRGGNVTISASESVSIMGSSETGLATTDFIVDPRSGIFSDAQAESSGTAGGISITTTQLTLGAQGTLSAQTAASGAGGSISVVAQDVVVENGGSLSTTSSGTGNAGNIGVVVGEQLVLRNGGLITTAATQADGGNISITTTGSLVHVTGGQITTSVQSGVGAGGNITIGSAGHPVEFVVLNGAEIRADAFGGPGGNVNIFAGTFLRQDSVLSASSALGVQGTIAVQAGVTEISGTVGQLPESKFQAAELLRAACATRLAGGQSSSLVVSGRGGLPPEPGRMLMSSLVAEGAADSDRSETAPHLPLWAFEPRCLR